MSLFYYFDIGNTRAKFWVCESGVIKVRSVIAYERRVENIISWLSSSAIERPDAILVASVLDLDAENLFSQSCHDKWQRIPQYARSSAQYAGVLNAYGERAASLGVDRWLGLIAAHGAQEDVCVVDCGTAITIDVLRRNGQHSGGYILPGFGLMLDALCQETQRVRVDATIADGLALGRSTSEAVIHGALMAVVSLVEHVVAQSPIRLILTGGDADRLSKLLVPPHTVEPDLLLHGLQRYFADAGIS
jgi:type III pantothenate kinase